MQGQKEGEMMGIIVLAVIGGTGAAIVSLLELNIVWQIIGGFVLFFLNCFIQATAPYYRLGIAKQIAFGLTLGLILICLIGIGWSFILVKENVGTSLFEEFRTLMLIFLSIFWLWLSNITSWAEAVNYERSVEEYIKVS